MLFRILSILIITFFSVHSTAQEAVSQCCILIDVFEDGKIIENEHEIWDLSFNPSLSHFSLGAASFLKADENNFYTYIWQHDLKSFKKAGDNTYEIICTGRMSNFDMHIIVSITNGRIKYLRATIPIGDDGKSIKEFKLNTSKKFLSLSPIYNSVYNKK